MTNWELFWSVKKPGFDCIMRNTTPFFFENYLQQNAILEGKVILDYGCGPGFLIEKLPEDTKIVGADISEAYIQFCREKFSHLPQVSFELISEQNPISAILTRVRPEIIIVVSVIQYFENNETLKSFLNSLKKHSQDLNEELTVIIADIIPENYSIFQDISNVLAHSIKQGYVLDFLKFMREVLNPDYRNQELKVNKTNPDFFENYCVENNLKMAYYNNLTVNKERYSVVITFS